MTDSNHKKLTVLTVLVAVLLVAVAAQSVMLFGLHKQWRSAPESEKSSRLARLPEDNDDADSTRTLPADPFADDSFDWDFEDWDPFQEMHTMHERINRMFDNAFNRFRRSDDFGILFGDHAFSPAIDIEDKGDRYRITVDLPGAEDSQLDVKLEGQTLTISGTVRSEEKEEDKGRILRQERRRGKFHRMVTLPSPVRADKMTTKHKKGVLYIEIPKASEED